MRKIKYFVIVGIALVLTVSVSLMFVGAADTWSTQVDISTKNSVTKIMLSGSTFTFEPEMFDITSTNYPNLAQLGLQYGFEIPSNHLTKFTGGNAGIMCDNFSTFYNSSQYQSLSEVSVSQYKYFTFTVICAVSANGHTVDRSFLNCGLSVATFPDNQLEFQFEDFVADNINMRCYTFGISSKDFVMPSVDRPVSQYLNALELLLYPKTEISHMYSSFTIMLSDIRLRLYTSDDIFLNGIGSLEDAIDKSNKEVLDKIDSATSEIIGAVDSQTDAILNADAPGEDIGGDVDDAADGLEDAEAAVDAVTPDFDAEILTGVPEELGEALSFIGLKLDTVIDGQFGTVVFFCLSFGVAMTLVGRAVR